MKMRRRRLGVKNKIRAYVGPKGDLSGKAFFNLILVLWILFLMAFGVVVYYAEKDIAEQIERNDMEKGQRVESR